MRGSNPVDIADVPHSKRILDTPITVDCFHIPVRGCTHYFLSHFHSDHYTRLKKSFKFPVYCSRTTAELVCAKIGCNAVGMEMYTNYDMGAFAVRLVEANHCPGAVLFIFLINSQFVLHTGDFRYNRRYHLLDISFKCVYLDNTYESFLNFPSQKEAIVSILSRFDQRNVLCPMNICVLCATYCIGKEKIFLSVAEYLDQSVQVTEERIAVYRCYSKHTVDKINRDVLEIVEERRKIEKTFGFKKHANLMGSLEVTKKKSTLMGVRRCMDAPPLVEYTNDKIKILDGIANPDEVKEATNKKPDNMSPKRMCLPDDGSLEDPSNSIDIDPGASYIRPFDRLTTEESPIKVVGMLNPATLDSFISKIYADKIIILYGSGWRDKEEVRAYRRMDGRTIKNGVEIVYFRYSEHSSSKELDEFKNRMNYEVLINTVINKASQGD